MNKQNAKLFSSSTGKINELSKTSVQRIQDKTNILRSELRSGGAISQFSPPNQSVVDETLNKQIEQLKNDLKRRQETYVRRERAYTVRIEELEKELQDLRLGKTKWMNDDKHMVALKKLHREILRNVDQVQDRTAKILQEQERDLLRAFRARLFDVQTELEKEKGKKDDGAAAYIEKCKELEEKVDNMKEMSDRLDRVNGALMRENARLKSQFQTQEEDREFLIKQLVQVKRENKRLNQQIEELEKNPQSGAGGSDGGDEYDNSKNLTSAKPFQLSRDALSSPMLPSAGAYDTMPRSSGGDATNNRLKDINKKLRKLLDRERKNLEMVRTQLTNELKQRTQLETLLRQCADDVKKEIKKRRRPIPGQMTARPSTSSKTGRPQTAEDDYTGEEFTKADRESVLELLLSQERVITLLYSKTFPPRNQEGESLDFIALAALSESDKNDANPGLPSFGAKSSESLFNGQAKPFRGKINSVAVNEQMPAI